MEKRPLLKETPTADERLASLINGRQPPPSIQRLAGDASTRVYYRASYSDGATSVIMLQPEPGLNLEASFLDVHRFLHLLDLPVPQITFHDSRAGILVLEDLGDDLLETVVERSDPRRIRDLYLQAVDLLVTMRDRTAGSQLRCVGHGLAFDRQKLMEELNFFMTHFVKGLCALNPPGGAEADLQTFFTNISRTLASEPRIFTHRDYHARNLILHNGRLVMIDFQDARMGPAQYDLASLLRDSYVTLPEDLVQELLDRYTSAVNEPDPDRFRYIFDVMSLQRNIKALGTFGYQISVRRAERYASSIARTQAYIHRNIGLYPEFASLRSTVEDFICRPLVK